MRREGHISPHAVIGQPAESRTATGDAGLYISPHATIEAYATVDNGTIQMTRIDPDAWIFKHAHVGHDAHIMEGAEVSTGAVIGGHAIVGPGARIGLNATILPWKVVGARAVIGAGAVVTHDVPPGETWAGNPARRMPDKTQAPLAETLPHSGRSESSWANAREIRREVMSRSSSEHEPITWPTPSQLDTSMTPASPTANSDPATPSPATTADEAWWAWLASRATQAKRTTLPKRPPGGFIEPSAPRVAKPAPSPRTHEVDL